MFRNELVRVLLIGLALGAVQCWIPYVGQEHHTPKILVTEDDGEWDILQMVALNASHPGVSHGPLGPMGNATTFRLKERATHAKLSPQETHKIVAHFRDSLSAFFVYRQHNNTVATLMGEKLAGNLKPWFQITSDLKRRRLQLIYRIKGDHRTHQVTFGLPSKVGNSWTKLLVTINATQVKVWVNCDTLEKAMLDAPIDLKLPNGGVFYFGQEPDFKNPLMGSIQTAKLFNFGMSSKVWRCGADGQFGPNWKPPLLG